MRKPIKMALGSLAFAAPILLGMAATGDIGFGEEDTEAVGNDGSYDLENRVDQWSIERNGSGVYTLDRVETDGVVTLTVTGPDGSVLEAGDYPDFVAEAVAEFGHPDWVPTDMDLVFSRFNDNACYDAELWAEEANANDDDDEPATDGGPRVMYKQSGDGGTFVLMQFDDGREDSAHFERNMDDDEEVLAHVRGGGVLADMDGARELSPCEN